MRIFEAHNIQIIFDFGVLANLSWVWDIIKNIF